jgi:hypothetical protein
VPVGIDVVRQTSPLQPRVQPRGEPCRGPAGTPTLEREPPRLRPSRAPRTIPRNGELDNSIGKRSVAGRCQVRGQTVRHTHNGNPRRHDQRGRRRRRGRGAEDSDIPRTKQS